MSTSRPVLLVMAPLVMPLLVMVLLVSGCGGGGGGDVALPVSTDLPTMEIATEIAPELLQPLEGLGPCENDPPEAVDADVEGLVLPEGARVTSVGPDGPVVQVEGWVPMTPVQVRAEMVTRDDLTVISVEDEVWESESLVSADGHRTFLKAQAICRTQSIFVALVSAETPTG